RLVVVAAEVHHPVDRSRRQVLGVLGTDDHVAKLARARDSAGPVDREREHVRGRVPAPVFAIQLPDPALVDQLDREMAVPHARRMQGGLGDGAKLRGYVREVEGQVPALSSRFEYSPYAATMRCTSAWRTTSSLPKRTNSMSATWDRISPTTTRPERCSRGRSIWVISPVTTILEPKPSRVRNIFICSGLVFCASSRITKEALRVL